MGSAVDYVRPVAGTTFCEMLNSFSRHQVSKSAVGGFVTPSYYTAHLGGSQSGWPSANGWDERNYAPSFWGHDAGYIGDGCCHGMQDGSDTAAWGRGFDIYILQQIT